MIKPSTIKEFTLIFKHSSIPLEVYQINETSRTSEYYIDQYRNELGYAGQIATKNIISDHFGWHDTPWCCFTVFNNKYDLNFGQFKPSAHYFWKEYSLIPKCLAFFNGRLTAFKAISNCLYEDFINNKIDFSEKSANYVIGQDLNIGKNEIEKLTVDQRKGLFWKLVKPWWDRNNIAHKGIPFTSEVPDDQMNRTAMFEYNETTQNIDQVSDFVLSKKNYNIHWDKNGTYKGIYHKNDNTKK